MKILYIYGTDSNRDNYLTLRRMGYDVIEYNKKVENSRLDDKEIALLVSCISTEKITHLMSTHLIFNVAVAAYKTDTKYVSVIWDAPYVKMYSPFGKLDNCWFSVFDRLDAERFRRAGIKHVLYQPLAVNSYAIKRWNLSMKQLQKGQYLHDVCFVGSLYSDNSYDQELGGMPAGMRDYFDSIFAEAAFRWDGKNRIYGKTGEDIIRYIKLTTPEFDIDHGFDVKDEEFFEAVYLVRKLANIERVCVLNMLAEYFDVSCYTYPGGVEHLKGVRVFPSVEYGEPLARVFANSKINLNISLKGIEGGTPKRVMDICGAGGFALSTYCEETADLFREGEEIEMFRTPEELVDKISFYLTHEDKRAEIAKKGCEKVLQNYTFEKQLDELMKWVPR